MKKVVFLFVLFFSSIHSFSQEESKFPFFSGIFHATFAINENFTLDPDDDQPLLVPNATFFRFEVGYQFNRRWAASFNFGYDYHFQYFINAIPTYGSIRYNITEQDRETFFAEYSRGKLWRPSFRFEDGDYSAFTLGWVIVGSKSTHLVLKATYHRKKLFGFENGRLDSFSLGVGFALF